MACGGVGGARKWYCLKGEGLVVVGAESAKGEELRGSAIGVGLKGGGA